MDKFYEASKAGVDVYEITDVREREKGKFIDYERECESWTSIGGIYLKELKESKRKFFR